MQAMMHRLLRSPEEYTCKSLKVRSGYATVYSGCSHGFFVFAQDILMTFAPLSCPLFLRFYIITEAVAHARDGKDELWLLGNRFNFLAQLGHVHMQAMHSGMRLGSQDLVQQHLPRQYFPAVCDQDFEQLVLGACQGNLLPIELHAPRAEVYLQRSRLEARIRAGLHLDDVAQSDPHARQHFV